MKVVLCANTKGGVGKTTTSVMLAWAAMQKGCRTALIDLDLNAQLSRLLQCWPKDAPGFLNPSQAEFQQAGAFCLLPAPGEDIWLDTAWHLADDLHTLIEKGADQGVEWLILDAPSGYFPLLPQALQHGDYLITPTLMTASQRYATLSYLKRMARVGLRDHRHLKVRVLPVMFSEHVSSHKIGLQALSQQVGAQRVLPPVPIDRQLQQLETWVLQGQPPRFSQGVRAYQQAFSALELDEHQ